MFYSGNYNPLGLNRPKRLIKIRTSTGDQDKQIKKILQSSRQPISYSNTANKENKINLRRQNKRFTDIEANDKNLNNFNQIYQKNLSIRDSQRIKNTNQGYPWNRYSRNQTEPLHLQQSMVFYRPKIDKIFINKDRNILSTLEADSSNSEMKISKNTLSKTKNRIEQGQFKNSTDRGLSHYPSFSRKIVERIKTMNSNKIKSVRSADQTVRKTIHYESTTIKGSKQINQDTVKMGDGVWIVCDGHGEHGHDVSWFAANMIFQLYQQKMAKQKFSKNLLRQIFIQVQQSLQDSQIDVSLSGSTCVMVVLVENKLYCACLGDSMAIAVNFQQQYQILSSQHKPCNSQQAKRIQFFGGVIKKTFGKQHLASSPLRLWGQGADSWGPGLAISRSFGDKMGQKYGLIYQPEIRQMNIESSTKYVVLGSDGLFDQIKPAQIASILNFHEKHSKYEGCRILSEIAQSRWIGYSDDISNIVIYL